ncbi:MAG: hypothetical protein U1D55_16770 [Phycisphaerae bacterium]
MNRLLTWVTVVAQTMVVASAAAQGTGPPPGWDWASSVDPDWVIAASEDQMSDVCLCGYPGTLSPLSTDPWCVAAIDFWKPCGQPADAMSFYLTAPINNIYFRGTRLYCQTHASLSFASGPTFVYPGPSACDAPGALYFYQYPATFFPERPFDAGIFTGSADDFWDCANSSHEDGPQRSAGFFVPEGDSLWIFVSALMGIRDQLQLSIDPPGAAEFIRVRTTADQRLLGASDLDANGAPLGPPLVQTTLNLPYSPSYNVTGAYLRIEGVKRGTARLVLSSNGTIIGEPPPDTLKFNVVRIESFFPDGEVVTPATISQQHELAADEFSTVLITSIELADETGTPYAVDDGTLISQYSASPGVHVVSPSRLTVNGFATTNVIATPVAENLFGIVDRVPSLAIGGVSVSFQQPSYPRSEVVRIVPGRPAVVAISPPTYPFSYPASDTNRQTWTVSARDQFGNALPDGTTATVTLAGTGAIDPPGSTLTLNAGSATFQTIAGYTPGTETLTVHVGEQESSLDIPQSSINISFQPTATTLTTGSDAFVDIDAVVVGAQGEAVADGTTVQWITSLGSFSVNGQRSAPVAGTTVTGGRSRIRLHTALADGVGSPIAGTDRPGTAHIIAGIGMSTAQTSIAFDPPATRAPIPLRLSAEHRALAGDTTTDGVLPVDAVDYLPRYDLMILIASELGKSASACPSCDLDGDGLITLLDLIRARNNAGPPPPTAPYFATSAVTISGVPHEVVSVSVSDPALVTIVGLGGGGQVTLDASGSASLTLQSTGGLSGARATVILSASRVLRGPGPDGDDDDVAFILAPKEDYSAAYNFFAGVVWGGGTGVAAIAGDTIVSFFLIGDLRDVAVNNPWNPDRSELTFDLALVGVATTLAPELDPAVGVIKSVIKRFGQFIPGSVVNKLFGRLFRDFMGRVHNPTAFLQLFEEWRPFFRVAIANSDFVKLIGRFERATLDASARVLKRLGDAWGGHFVAAAARTSANGAAMSVRIIDRVDDATKQLLLGWLPHRQERLVAALAKARGKVIGANRIAGALDEAKLVELVTKENISTIEQYWPHANFDLVVERLGRISEKGAENADVLLTRLNAALDAVVTTPNTGALNNLRGVLFEISRISELAESQSVTWIRLPTAGSVTELDAVYESGHKYILEAKYGVSWNPASGLYPPIIDKQQADLIRAVQARVAIAADPSNALFGAVVRIEHFGDLPFPPAFVDKLQALGTARGITVEVAEVAP